MNSVTLMLSALIATLVVPLAHGGAASMNQGGYHLHVLPLNDHSIMFNYSRTTAQSSYSSYSKTNTQSSSSSHRQQTIVNLDPDSLKEPNMLTIKASTGAQLRGQVMVNGVVLHKLSGNQAIINLSSHLGMGRNAIEISGGYQPQDASVLIKFAGSDTTITQQSQGNGTLKQTLIFEIR
jgi:hypothetical protein